MAEVIGPCSTLPGDRHTLPDNAKCDVHPDRDAMARIQGETDSFGAELHDLCWECVKEHNEAERNRDRSGVCDWCHTEANLLRDRRDFEEGLAGRVYRVCAACIKKEYAALEVELASYEPLEDYEDYSDY